MASGKGERKKGRVLVVRAGLGAGGGCGNRRLKSQKKVSLKLRC